MASFPEQPPDWANLKVLHRNILPSRANFKIYNSEPDALSRDESKARACSLTGKWKFHFANSTFGAPEGFEAATFDTSDWSDISVPSHWQLQGFGRGPQYVNVQYPFHVNPPLPPFDDNECGSYVTTFAIPKQLGDDQLRLRFEGVDSAYHVWVNGSQVGYHQGSRNPAEFDITDHVKRGQENTLAVRVYQYSDGSYIEDQDQWRMSGIFRDVFLLGFPRAAHFRDFNVRTVLDEDYENATLKVEVNLEGAGTVQLKLLDAEHQKVVAESSLKSTIDNGSLRFSMPIANPHKWTAETPYLYQLVLSLDEAQFVTHHVGFRQVELKDGLIKVNGQRVVFKGANRHEHHPVHGRSVPYEFMKQDLVLMKTHNINAIRCCHQPSDPRFYDLADEMGFWVMDEADLECHGFETIADAALGPAERDLPFFERQQITKKEAVKWTSDNTDWRDAYVDRAVQLVHRDKLHPSVIMWSLGNEAFWGRNHVAMAEWIRSYDSTRLIHYEPDLEAEVMDMHSRMYPDVEDIIAFGEDATKTKPLVLCEYIHAMGTGPGNIAEYVDAFYKYPTLQGGWVWEWANHGLLTKTKDGKEYYAYGGDFGDAPNDGNFVMDGMLNSDHTPNSGLTEYKKTLEPVQFVSTDGKTIKIINRHDFVSLDGLICDWSTVGDGCGATSGSLEIPREVPPGGTAELTIPEWTSHGTQEVLLNLSFSLKEATSWAKVGFEVARIQVPLSEPSPVARVDAIMKQAVSIENTNSELNIKGGKSDWTISLASGALTSWKKGGHDLIAGQPLQPSFFRAPTDNDCPQDGRDWLDRNLQHAAIHNIRTEYTQNPDLTATVVLTQRFAPKALSWSFNLTTTLTFHPAGSLDFHVRGTPAGANLPKTLPRIGVTLGLPASFQEIEWFGRGPGESYRDMKQSQPVGRHKASRVQDLWTAPEYPQECSNRTDTRWLKVSDREDASVGLTAQFYTPGSEGGEEKRHFFDFMASHYDVGDISEAKHPFELEERRKEHVVLRLDAAHHGLGTGSCGPKTLEKYALKMVDFEFGMVLY